MQGEEKKEEVPPLPPTQSQRRLPRANSTAALAFSSLIAPAQERAISQQPSGDAPTMPLNTLRRCESTLELTPGTYSPLPKSAFRKASDWLNDKITAVRNKFSALSIKEEEEEISAEEEQATTSKSTLFARKRKPKKKKETQKEEKSHEANEDNPAIALVQSMPAVIDLTKDKTSRDRINELINN